MRVLPVFWLIAATAFQAQLPPGIPPGAELIGPPLSYGTILYDAPAAENLALPGDTPLVPNAIIAEQRVDVLERRLILESPLTTGRPFNLNVPAGSYFGVYRTPDGERRCLRRMPMVTFQPARDERGEIYPAICLDDANSDGEFDRVRMLPYLARNQSRSIDITPIRLRPAPRTIDPRAPRFHLFRRLRIRGLDRTIGRVTVVLEHAAGRASENPEYRVASQSDIVTLPLRQGASASVGGIHLRVLGHRSSWSIAARGAFAPWVTLQEGGSAVRAGPIYIAPRED